MNTDIRDRGGKKFGHLFLVHPNIAVASHHRDAYLAVEGVVDDEVLLGGDYFILCYVSPNPVGSSYFFSVAGFAVIVSSKEPPFTTSLNLMLPAVLSLPLMVLTGSK